MAATKTRRDYRDAQGKKLPGVTTILGILDKPALLPWAAGCGARAAARAADQGLRGEDLVAVAKAAWRKERDAAADAGTLAHAYVEAHFAGEGVMADLDDPQQAQAHGVYRRVIDHLTDTGTEVLVSEVAMVHEANGFGGTVDFVLERDGVRYIADLKTGKRAYDEVIAQISAYRALWVLHHPETPIHAGLVVHAPLEGPVVEHLITSEQLDIGAALFAAAHAAYRLRPQMKLGA
jgi:hypothetical protein